MNTDNRKYFFVGTRFYCLEKMLEMNLNLVQIAVVKETVVQRELEQRNISHIVIENKNHLLKLIESSDFDVLVSNGCPYILPISKLRKGEEIYINLHPSLLPDLRGFSPVNGSVLFERSQGATCHFMDDGVDTGSIIAQSKITDNGIKIPLDLLYQLSFLAEADAFVKAYNRNFAPRELEVHGNSDLIYYSRKLEDQYIDANEKISDIIKKVKAFAVEGQYARIKRGCSEYCVKEMTIFDCTMFDSQEYKENEVIYVYRNNVISKKEGKYLLWRLDFTEGIIKGQNLFDY